MSAYNVAVKTGRSPGGLRSPEEPGRHRRAGAPGPMCSRGDQEEIGEVGVLEATQS